jgi:hypothetical protein
MRNPLAVPYHGSMGLKRGNNRFDSRLKALSVPYHGSLWARQADSSLWRECEARRDGGKGDGLVTHGATLPDYVPSR